MSMRRKSMANEIFGTNYESERAEHEFKKYGRVSLRDAVQFPTRDKRHSIEPAYGNYDRPINEVV